MGDSLDEETTGFGNGRRARQSHDAEPVGDAADLHQVVHHAIARLCAERALGATGKPPVLSGLDGPAGSRSNARVLV